jgi:hypothetical protein
MCREYNFYLYELPIRLFRVLCAILAFIDLHPNLLTRAEFRASVCLVECSFSLPDSALNHGEGIRPVVFLLLVVRVYTLPQLWLGQFKRKEIGPHDQRYREVVQ